VLGTRKPGMQNLNPNSELVRGICIHYELRSTDYELPDIRWHREKIALI